MKKLVLVGMVYSRGRCMSTNEAASHCGIGKVERMYHEVVGRAVGAVG